MIRDRLDRALLDHCIKLDKPIDPSQWAIRINTMDRMKLVAEMDHLGIPPRDGPLKFSGIVIEDAMSYEGIEFVPRVAL